MKKLIWTFFVLIALSSCVTQKRCNEKFPPEISEVTIVHDSIVHDTISVPYQELSFDTTSPCPPQVEYHKEKRVGGLVSSVTIHKGVITQKCSDDSLQVVINSLHRIILTHKKEAPKTVEVKHIPWWAYACAFLAAILLITNLTTLFIYERGRG